MNYFKIKQATSKDLPSILLLNRMGYTPEYRESDDRLKERLEVFPAGFYIAQEEGTNDVVGFITTYLEDSTYPFLFPTQTIKDVHDENGDHLFLHSMVIHPKYRLEGIGTQLLESSVELINEQLKGRVICLSLIININWDGAYDFFLKQGFAECRFIENYFKPVGGKGKVDNGMWMDKWLV